MTRFPGAPRGSYVNGPHVFEERTARWNRASGNENPFFGGCRKCGASELSAIHLGGDNPIDGSETVAP